MKKVLLTIDTTRGGWTDWAGSPFDGISVVNGDTVLFACRFTESLVSTPAALDLTGALALRCTVKSARTSAATLWTFQDAYNGGHYPAGEVLASGYVTWLVSFSSAAITSALGTGESASGYLELTYLDASNYPQTLVQIPITIYQQEDDGAPGSPPPTSPTYLTAVEVAEDYVAKNLFDAQTVLAATADNTPAAVSVTEQTVLGRLTGGNIKALSTAELIGLVRPTDLSLTTTATLAAVNGRQWVFCSTAGGNWQLSLPSAATFANCEFWIVKTVAANTLTIAPDGSETINGASGNVTLSTQWATLCLKSDGTNWVCPIMAQP